MQNKPSQTALWFQSGRRKAQRFVPLRTGLFAHYELWKTLAHQDLRNRYRGSFLGPLWLTITTGILVSGIGLLYGGLFGQPLESYLPYIAISIVIWTLVSTTLSEAATLFPGEGILLKQLPVPASIFVTRLVYRNLLVFAHNCIIVIIVFLIYPPDLSWNILALIPGFFILVANLWWICVLISALGTRFGDVPPIVLGVLQIFFFLTPIIWRAEDLPGRAIFVDFNPFYHLIETMRAPLINDQIAWISLAACLFGALVGVFAAMHILEWTRTRLIYWL